MHYMSKKSNWFPLPHYMEKILKENPPLKPGEDRTVTRERLIMGNQYFVVKQARIFARTVEELADYVQQGNVALCIAAETWEPEKGAFITWAAFEIRNQMQIQQRKMMLIYAINSTAYQNRNQILIRLQQGESREAIAEQLGLEPYHLEMALDMKALDIDEMKLAQSAGRWEEVDYQREIFNKKASTLPFNERQITHMTLNGFETNDIARTLELCNTTVYLAKHNYAARFA